MFVDVHSHVVPSGDDGVRTVEEGLDLCREAAGRGTAVLFATPHVWPNHPLTEERERDIRAAHRRMAAAATEFGLDLRLGFELTPTTEVLEQDPRRFRLPGTDAVLMELPFAGPLDLAERLAEHIDAAALTPVIAHPERADAILADSDLLGRYRARGWLLQVNATSLLGDHGEEREELAWLLVDAGLVDLVASDGHRAARPPFLDAAYRVVRERVGEEADALFDGRRLPGLGLAPADAVDLAERR